MAGRGRAAAQVTSRDAASQLVAVAASRNVKDSVETVRQYGGLISTAKRWDCPFFNPPEMAALGSKHTIIEAIASLIEDLRTTTSFGHFTIMDVARLLRSGTLNTNKSPATQALLDLSK